MIGEEAASDDLDYEPVTLLGRMACESSEDLTCEEAIASNRQLAPDLEKVTSLDDPSPASATPHASGHDPVAMPGTTQVLQPDATRRPVNQETAGARG